MAIADADVLSAAAGDEAAMARLFERHNPSMVSYAYSVLRDSTAANDAAQSAWAKIVRHIGGYRGDATFGTWVISVTRNEALMTVRRERKRRSDTPLSEVIGPDGAVFENRHAAVEGMQHRRAAACDVERLLADLREDWCEVVRLVYLDGLTTVEAAQRLGITTACAKTRLMRGMTRLRQMVGEVAR